MEDDGSRSESPDELDHTSRRQLDDEGDRESTDEDGRGRSRTPITPDDEDDDDREDRDDDDTVSPRTPPTPPKKPFKYKLSYSFLAHDRGIAQTKFSPNGVYLASVSADKTAKIWMVQSGQLVHTLDGHLAGISALSWSPDSLHLATGSDDKTIRIWNVETGEQVHKPWYGHSNYVFSVAFSPKGNMLASGSYDEALFIWDVRGARQMRSLPAHSDPIGSVDFTPDGTLVASCATDGLIRVWDTGSGQCLRTIVHEDNAKVVSLRFSPNGKYIAAWTVDNCVRLWDFVTGQCKKTYQGHKNTKYSASGAFGVWEDEAFLVGPSEDGRIVFWDVKSKAILQEIKAHNDVVMCVDTDTATQRIVSCDKAGYIKVWEPASVSEWYEEGAIINRMGTVELAEDCEMGEWGDADEGTDESAKDDQVAGRQLQGGSSQPAPAKKIQLLAQATRDPNSQPREHEESKAPAPIPMQEWKITRNAQGNAIESMDGADERPLRGGASESPDADIKVEDLMQEMVDDIMSDGADAEEQIKSEMGRM